MPTCLSSPSPSLDKMFGWLKAPPEETRQRCVNETWETDSMYNTNSVSFCTSSRPRQGKKRKMPLFLTYHQERLSRAVLSLSKSLIQCKVNIPNGMYQSQNDVILAKRKHFHSCNKTARNAALQALVVALSPFRLRPPWYSLPTSSPQPSLKQHT